MCIRDSLKLKQKTDRARSLAKQADLLNGQLTDLEKQRFAATRRAANAKAGHAADVYKRQAVSSSMSSSTSLMSAAVTSTRSAYFLASAAAACSRLLPWSIRAMEMCIRDRCSDVQLVGNLLH